MIYSKLKTGKLKCIQLKRYPEQTAVRDTDFIKQVAAHPAVQVFSIPELVEFDPVPQDSSVKDYMSDVWCKPGICIRPPYEMTWWETKILWRGIERVEYNGVVVAAYLSPSTIYLAENTDLLQLMRTQGWTGMVCMIPFIDINDGLSSLCAHVFAGLDEKGEIISFLIRTPSADRHYEYMAKDFMATRGQNYSPEATAYEMEWALGEQAAYACLSVIRALALLNCKNISTDDHPFVTGKSRKKSKRLPLARAVYRTLKLIVPGQKVRGIKRPSDPDAEKKALHLVRGHFAIYEEGHGLFGKYPGRYWIPAHVRGTKEAGIVTKTYELETK